MSGEGETRPGASNRRFLFLQGPLSPLYRLLGDQLRSGGGEVHRINFCAGDWLHWHGKGCISFRGTTDSWPEYVSAFMDRERITDVVLHADQRIYHKAAVAEAQKRGIRVFVSELGLLRSGWMTLEREGLATLSRFPSDPLKIRGIAQAAGEIDFSPRYPKSAYLEIVPDVIYNLTNVFLGILYPNYQRHTLYPPVMEYLRGGWRLLTEAARAKKVRRQIEDLHNLKTPYFIFPLQLEGDFQLRAHSPYSSFADVIALVFASFAECAPGSARLVLKTHPLDVGYEGWPDVVRRLSQQYGITDRVLFLDGGRLDSLFERASGLVTLNSTAGLEAMQAGLPVKTLMPAHYDVAGLTHAGGLSGFWIAPDVPDQKLLEDYLKAIAATVQVRGSIHNAEGTEAAARNMAARLLALTVNEPGGFVEPPPRLAKARSLGVPL